MITESKKNKSFDMKILLTLFTLSVLISGKSLKAQDKLYPNTFPLSSVRLNEGPFKHAQDLNIQSLLKYDPDRLLAPFLREARLESKASPYGNWESDGLDGHIGGHYLSAMAMHYASSGNTECLKRLEYMVDELKKCQEANTQRAPQWAAGYLGGIPNGDTLWTSIRAGNTGIIWKYWVPWYNLHKTFAGLRDAWSYAGNETAREIFLKYCDWAIQITSGLSDQQLEAMLDNEHGGMNEVFADAYQMTGKAEYLLAAKRFSHKAILDPMALGHDNLDNKHANTQVPKAVGFQRIAEVCGDEKHQHAGSFFWNTVTQNRSLAMGGNSRHEFFPPETECMDYIHSVEGPESCNTNNMMKLTQILFRMNPEAHFADYFENAMFNHILSTQHPEHGGYVYFTPARPRHYRVYSAPNEAMWCCVGTGMENHAKYGEFIYTHQHDSLYLNLFIASTLHWKEKSIHLTQETRFPEEEKTKLIITKGNAGFALMVRYPGWVKAGKLQITINGKSYPIATQPGSYVSIMRQWKQGDVIEINLPMHTQVEELPNVTSYIALRHGPILLGAKTGIEDLKGLVAGSGRWEHVAGGSMLPVNEAPMIVEDDRSKLETALVPVPGKPLHFTAPGLNIINAGQNLEFEPFYGIHDARYMMYWLQLSNKAYEEVLDSLAREEKARLQLETRTIDKIQPGQQQPEADHYLKSEHSGSGIYMNEFWRDARDGGFFSYNLNTKGETNLSLRVRYWGNENTNRTFELLVDDQVLATENTNGKWKVLDFREVEYPIPASMLEGKNKITLKFKPLPGNTAGGIFFVRLIRNEQ
jgi:uncharacterized protein